ncbi:protein-ADP-ribose hydrolase [Veillonella parvula]|uniref:protein-ADP-ribose hydrolase n=1 Tax=Veillonella parvula TaxID=29466 RepID=UPI0019618271|nr:protein-ADP-ribose hydrolase [Veillonella parvula]VTY45583.1 Protein-ADP-ribose hydrolase [Veillonella parvula]
MTQQERLRYLLEGLVAEYKEKHNEDIDIPMNEEEQFTLFRSLCNIRPAGGMPSEWMKVEDEYLNTLAHEKGIVTINDMEEREAQMYLWQGDITRLAVDAIVNAANNQLLGCFAPNHKCIDNAIHTFSGIELRMECARMIEYMEMPEKTGVARMTYGFNLPASHVIHTVGPIVYDTVTDLEKEQLSSCYRSCLELANAYSLKSIAFCCISTGEFRFPNELAAQIAIDTVRRYLKETNSKIQVVFNVFKDIDYDIYNKLLG